MIIVGKAQASLAPGQGFIGHSTHFIEQISEQAPLVKEIDLDHDQAVLLWLKRGHSLRAVISSPVPESIMERAAFKGAEKVFNLCLREFAKTGDLQALFDSHGTPLALQMFTLDRSNTSQVKKRDRMIMKLLSVFPRLSTVADRSYFGDGRTAFHQVAETCNFSLYQWMVAHGAPVDQVTHNGETALHFAARAGCIPIVRSIVKRGAKINAHSKYTLETPLILAAEFGKIAMMRELIALGADPNAKDTFGKTAWDRLNRHRFVSQNKGHLFDRSWTAVANFEKNTRF